MTGRQRIAETRHRIRRAQAALRGFDPAHPAANEDLRRVWDELHVAADSLRAAAQEFGLIDPGPSCLSG